MLCEEFAFCCSVKPFGWYCAWTKLTEHPGERGNPSPQTSTNIITTQQAPHNTSPLLSRLMGAILSTEYCNVFKLFLLIFLCWVGVIVSRLTTSRENYERSLIG